MILIIGGAYQGKLTYAVKEYGLSEDECFDLAGGCPDKEYRCFYHLEAFLRTLPDAEEALKKLMPYIKNSIVISREVGCGIVPTDASERQYREAHGALLRALCEKAEAVTRIFCGLKEELK